ncbi:ABC-2 type transporter-domain-containing protein [Coemansia mojavensis]|nr:ABC-2 type transporter-domain-containing protein [Coemansia mojavensis]
MSFGEPLHVNISRASTRFESIQRAHSRQAASPEIAGAEEEAEAGEPGFNLTEWLRGRDKVSGPPFAKRFGLVFRDLSIYGTDVSNKHISTLVTPIWKLIKGVRNGWGVPEMLAAGISGNRRQLTHSFSGEVKEGEMLLVLGRPGSGCSTLLRVLGNRCKGYKHIDGKVSYGGLSPDEVQKHYRGEVAHNAEEDFHFPTLTVRQTLEFAIRCKTPSAQVLDDREKYRTDVLDMLLDMYGLRSCADTIVGNAFLRGVSGGERKRVSIAEQVAAGAAIEVWDGSTRGLDSSSALDYVRSLRIGADVLQKAVVASIYQASESIYKLFDKVMVIDEGRQLYFGSTADAIPYFESLGIEKPARQTSSDFLTGLTQLNERRVRKGYEQSAPTTAEEFERAWLASEQCQAMHDELEAFEGQIEQDGRSQELREFVNRTKMGTEKHRLRARSPYTTTFMFQLQLLAEREWQIFTGNLTQIIFKVIYNIAFALILGTAFIALPQTSAGIFQRGGALFTALLLSTLTSQSEIPKAVSGRLTIYKHHSLAMYHPAALSLAQTLVDFPFSAMQSMIFSIIFYFLVHLVRTAPHFFTFFLYLFMGSISHTISGIGLLLSILYTGFLQAPNEMHPWFIWISWATPLSYALKALLCNEFRDLNIRCVGSNLIPGGPGFADISNQVCVLPGARPGQLYITGQQYLASSFGIYVKDQWRYFGGLVGFWLAYTFLIALCMEWLEFGNQSYSLRAIKRFPPRINPPVSSTSSMSSLSMSTASGERKDPTDDEIAAGTTYTWRHINYTVPIKGGERQLLDNVSGYIKPGSMTALMGSSGAGKTTLLDSLSQRKTIGKLEGEMLLNGAELPLSFRRSTGYAEQLDVHAPLVTVRELLRFSAYLRRPASVSKREKEDYVERVIYLLGMTDIANCLVGDPESSEGISLEERKRLTIGVELVSKPKILFLDEPTSGLDAQASFKIVQILRRLADEGQTILCTIHQPSALLFEQFDRLLLLIRGGHTVYFGDIGKDAHTLIDYFERNGAPKCPPSANPAEYMLDALGSSGADIDWPQRWDESDEQAQVQQEIDRINQLKIDRQPSLSLSSQGEKQEDREFAYGHLFQLQLVMRRMFLMQWRNLSYNYTKLALQVFCGLFIGFTFFRLANDISSLQQRTFAILQSVVISILLINSCQPEYFRQRQYYSRESSTNQYSWLAFSISVIFVEWPFTIVANTAFVVCFYWTAGLNSASNRVGYFYIIYVLLGLYAISLGQFVASWTPNDIVASMINPIFTTMATLFAGAFIPYASLPLWWRRWMYHISPFRYPMEGIIANDLHDFPIRCRPKEFYIFEPPAGSTCGQYAGSWISGASGYIENMDASSGCRYCQYKVGDEYTQTLDWDFVHRWRNFLIFLGFTFFDIGIIILMNSVYKVNKR